MTSILAPLARLRRRHDTIGWLWLLVGSVGLFTLVATIANAFLPAGRATTLGDLGHDFLAFYSAGRLVDTGRADQLYDLPALEHLEHSIASIDGIDHVAPPVAPWWNPPQVALLFTSLSRLGFYPALAVWSAIGLACLAVAAWLMTTLFEDAPLARRGRLLIPATLVFAPATLQALGHGQNTFCSLLMLTIVILAWRKRMPILAGLSCALLFYKPQLAGIVAVALVGTLGWRVLVGLMLGLVPQALACVTLLPGALTAFFTRLPTNLRHIQFEQPYLWHRHATFSGFWHYLLQGNAPGQTSMVVTALSLLCVGIVATTLIVAWYRLRPGMDVGDDISTDRFIAAVVLAMPLLMPFFFDYDLLLLTIAGVLIGREMLVRHDGSRAATTLRTVGAIAFVWSMWNPALAEMFKLNLTVPLLSILFACQARRCFAHAAVAPVDGFVSDGEEELPLIALDDDEPFDRIAA